MILPRVSNDIMVPMSYPDVPYKCNFISDLTISDSDLRNNAHRKTYFQLFAAPSNLSPKDSYH